MQPRFETLPAKLFCGIRMSMSYVDNKTGQLWRRFMLRRMEISQAIGTELYSMEVYPATFFENFNPEAIFEKWAAVEVAEPNDAPADMEILNIPAGLYAVFTHYGPAANGPETYRYIFTEWLPASGYRVAHRPHFAVMGEKYKSDSADSEEEIWIPICK
ncbi:GyrI-like domain-containing protein [Mucilaginibacter psychrotolerans]|uniref:AraC family transcriptional regulator n=1 Tax=Mucilaginibacter psychrotolerans TaxID=1524096 RepID=A0A4Y8SL73_9SPHI|nr:GyrI-like domain-containing protein [Mucilaginibacter psychrotolerans]TFF39156.1 AraC family transcriptional regulator [Mucilaginibacter psychrotolerans]